jgi:hypothetical protein
MPIDIEPGWAKEKAARQEIETVAGKKPKKQRWKLGVTLAILVVVAGVITAGVIVQHRSQRDDYTAAVPRPEGMVGIQIRSNPAAQIRVDGNKAGKTPLTLHMRKSTKQVRIDAVIGGTTQTKLIVPDQDQDVAFTR